MPKDHFAGNPGAEGGDACERTFREGGKRYGLYALETLLKNKSWVTDPQVLQDVPTEYSRQVQAYFDEA